MSVSLVKGEKVNLSKEVNGRLEKIIVGLGWDIAKKGNSIDCDSSVFVLKEKENNKHKFMGLFRKDESKKDIGIVKSSDIVYYGHLHHSSGCIDHKGDNLVGGSGKRNDDEQIVIDLKNMPIDIKKLVVVVNIYSARSRHQHFGMINNCYARIVDRATNEEICRYNLTDDYSNKTALIVGEFYRDNNNEWQFSAIGKGTEDTSIEQLADKYR